MKRSPLGPGPRSLERGSTFPRTRKPLKRTASAARRRARKPAWWSPPFGTACECGCGRPAVHGHHIISAQELTRRNAPLYSRPNRMWVAAECHADHHAWSRRLSLPDDHPVWAFAEHMGLSWWLLREYRDRREAAA